MLLRYLDRQRDHVLGILDGLSDDDLRRPVLPSGWSCAAMVHHLALDVERFWFQAVVAGDEQARETDGWRVPEDLAPSAVLDLYRAQIAVSDRIVAERTLDTRPAWTPGYFPDPHRDLEQTLLHVITETACHAGHLDAARELIDGRTWLVL